MKNAIALRFSLKSDANLFLDALRAAAHEDDEVRVLDCTKAPGVVYLAVSHPFTLDGRDVRTIAAPFGGKKHRGAFPTPAAVARRIGREIEARAA